MNASWRVWALLTVLPSLAQAQGESSFERMLSLPLTELGGIDFGTATGTPSTLRQTPAVASVITAEEIAAMGARDLEQVLAIVPGLHIERAFQINNPKIVIRGISSQYNPHTLVLINGIPITSLFVGNRSNVWGGMPVKAIARIEVIRGPGSAVHGADAFAGVVNIITKAPERLAGTTTGIGGGSFDTQYAWAQHGGDYGPVQLGLSLEAGQTDGQRRVITADQQTGIDNLGPILFPPPPPPPVSLAPGPINVGVRWLEFRSELSWQRWRWRLGAQDRSHGGTGTGVASALDPVGKFGSTRLNTDVSYYLPTLARDWDLTVEASYYYGDQQSEQQDLIFPPGAFWGSFPDGFTGNPEFREEQARFGLSTVYTGAAAHRWRLGAGYFYGDIYEVKETKNFRFVLVPGVGYVPVPLAGGVTDVTDTPDVYMTEKLRKSEYAFVQDEWQLAPTWALTAGVRYDHYSDVGSTTNPRLALVWNTTPALTTKLLYGEAFRPPAMVELYIINNPVALGNPELKPEKLRSLELALGYQAGPDQHLALNVYTFQVKDLINFVPDSNGLTSSTQNVDELRGRGLEAEWRYRPRAQWQLLANYTLQSTENTRSKREIGHSPRQEVYGRATWDWAPLWQLTGQVTAVGRRQRAQGDPRSSLHGYTSWDLTLRRVGLAQQLDLAVVGRNLFDADIREPSDEPNPGAAYVNIPNDIPEAGRSLMVEAQWRW